MGINMLCFIFIVPYPIVNIQSFLYINTILIYHSLSFILFTFGSIILIMGICNQKQLGDDRPSTSNNRQVPKTKQMTMQQRIANSKFKHKLYEFCERMGKYPSCELTEWIQSTYKDNYYSKTTMLNGTVSERKSRQDLLNTFDMCYKNGWEVSVFLISGVFEKQGTQEWISWIYRIMVPNPNSSLPTQYLYSSISIFDIQTEKWEKSEYTQMEIQK